MMGRSEDSEGSILHDEEKQGRGNGNHLMGCYELELCKSVSVEAELTCLCRGLIRPLMLSFHPTAYWKEQLLIKFTNRSSWSCIIN